MEKVYNDIDVIDSKEFSNQPYIIRPSVDSDFRIIFKGDNKEFINKKLLSHGAVLLRGFNGLDNAQSFQQVFQSICGDMLEYKLQTSPRTSVGSNVYTSTDHPASQHIHMHTESSYSKAWPRQIGFFCLIPSSVGGETPIVRERNIIDNIDLDVLAKFRNKGVKYIRNFNKGLGLSWQQSYQVNTKEEVENLVKEQGMNCKWLSDDHLRVEWIMPAFQIHPVTNEELWFNHMYFGHKSLYDKKVLSVIPEDFLPFLTYYGDGEPIEDEVIDQFTSNYKASCFSFKWELGDLLLLENMIYSHGRYPFEGERKILVGMANEVTV